MVQQIEPGVIDIPFQKLIEINPKTAEKVLKLVEKGDSAGVKELIKKSAAKIEDKRIKKAIKGLIEYIDLIEELTESAESAADEDPEMRILEARLGSLPKIFQLINELGLPKEVKQNLDRALLAAKGMATKINAQTTEGHQAKTLKDVSPGTYAHYKKEFRAAFRGLILYSGRMPEIATFVKYWTPAIENELIVPATAQQTSGSLLTGVVISIFGIGVIILGPLVNSKEVAVVGILISIFGLLSSFRAIK